MKPRLHLLFLGFFIWPLALLAQQAGEGPLPDQPRLEFLEADYDFDTVPMGTVVRHDFQFQNAGTADLILYKAKGGCTCVQVEYQPDTLAPGDTSAVTMVFNTQNRVGKERNSVMLTTNTPEKIHRIWFQGQIAFPEKAPDKAIKN